jgi:hypothetical protein
MTIQIKFTYFALLCACLSLLPTKTLAKSGGMPGASASPALRAPIARPAVTRSAAPSPVARPAVHSASPSAQSATGGPLIRAVPAGLQPGRTVLNPNRTLLNPNRTLLDPSRTTLHHDNLRLHGLRPLARRGRPFGWPQFWWDDGSIYSYDPNAQTAPTAEFQPFYPTDLGPGPYYNPAPARRACTSEEYKVPAEGGGESTVNVVRC